MLPLPDLRVLAPEFGALATCGIAFHAAALVAARKFVIRRTPACRSLPAVSVLKPVRGVDTGAYENYRSFCCLDYPEYELIFGVQDPDDPAIALVERLQAEFPNLPVRLVVRADRVGVNLKVCNLHNMLKEARHELLVISDADMRVRPEYLREVVPYLGLPEVKLVTSPYCGIGAESLPAGLEALGMATEFLPGVLVASELMPPAFGLGSTLALSRTTLRELGGFKELSQYLADDYQLGVRAVRSGGKVAMTRYLVETALPNEGLAKMLARRVRWMRTARVCRPVGFAGAGVTHATVWTLLTLLLAGPQPWALGLLATHCVMRAIVVWAYLQRVAGARLPARWALLLPVSDVLNFVLWIASWCGNTVSWRGERFRVSPGGKINHSRQTAPEPGEPARSVGA